MNITDEMNNMPTPQSEEESKQNLTNQMTNRVESNDEKLKRWESEIIDKLHKDLRYEENNSINMSTELNAVGYITNTTNDLYEVSLTEDEAKSKLLDLTELENSDEFQKCVEEKSKQIKPLLKKLNDVDDEKAYVPTLFNNIKSVFTADKLNDTDLKCAIYSTIAQNHNILFNVYNDIQIEFQKKNKIDILKKHWFELNKSLNTLLYQKWLFKYYTDKCKKMSEEPNPIISDSNYYSYSSISETHINKFINVENKNTYEDDLRNLFNYLLYNNVYSRKKWYNLFLNYFKQQLYIPYKYVNNTEQILNNLEKYFDYVIIHNINFNKIDISKTIFYILKNNLKDRTKYLLILEEVRKQRIHALISYKQTDNGKH